ncbi:MAG TPA: UrcA family protein [Caulobacteraceae bacterium]|jgi:UrcA family protein
MINNRNSQNSFIVAGAAALAGLTLAASPALAQSSYSNDGYYQNDRASYSETSGDTADITIYAPRHSERSSSTGAPIETVSASRVVYVGDLDLGARWGVSRAKARIVHAARDACNQLDETYPSSDQDTGRCVPDAVSSAMYQVQRISYRYSDDQ